MTRDLKTRIGGIVEAFFENLSPTEKELFKATTVVENLLADIESVDKKHKSISTSRKPSTVLKPFIAGIEQYGAAFDVIVNSSSTILSLLWGSFRIVLILAKYLLITSRRSLIGWRSWDSTYTSFDVSPNYFPTMTS